MQNYSYIAEFEHGSAAGEVQAHDAKEAKDRVKSMYHDKTYDTVDSKGAPIVKQIVVTDVKVTLAKE